MKRILVPTDFSDNADRARDYAINLAELLDAEVFLLNTYHIPHAGATMVVDVQALARESSEAEMAKQLKYLTANFPELDVRTKCVAGLLVDVIKRFTEKEEVDLIVMGTKGASGVSGFFLGSNTSALIGEVKVPMITVPANAVINFPEKIVVANDLKKSGGDGVFDVLKQIVNKTKASVNFLFIADEEEKTNRKIEKLKAADFNEEFDSNYLPFHFKESDNVEDGILKYIEDKDFDLLVVVCHQRSFWQKLMERSVSKSLVKSAQIPILILTD